MDTVAFIFARGGSKGLPGKNIRPLMGKPLIAWSIEQAKMVKKIRRVIVSTDSDEIAEVARDYGAEVPFMRPPELAVDNSPELLSWCHALRYLQENEGKLPTAMVAVPATAPLRLPSDIETCLNEYEKSDVDAIITVIKAQSNPYFSMVKPNTDGSVGLVISPEVNFIRRQDTPPVFNITPIAYVVRPEFILTGASLFEGTVRAVHMPPERAIDIDTLFDFEIAEILMEKRKLA